MKKAAFVYITDTNYLFGTLLAAQRCSTLVNNIDADVRVFWTGADQGTLKQLQADPLLQGVVLESIDFTSDSLSKLSIFQNTHVSPSAAGRLLITEYIKDEYGKLIYVDGDTWFLSSPDELVNLDAPESKFFAAEDIASFQRYEIGPGAERTRKYFLGIGLGDRGYFNSGLIIASPTTWNEIGARAYDYLLAKPENCLYHDQSALNASCADQRLYLHLKFNYTTTYHLMGMYKSIAPVMLHFIGRAKPWATRINIWGSILDEYYVLMDRLAYLPIPQNRLSVEDSLSVNKYLDGQRLRLNTVFLARKLKRISRIQRLEELAWKRDALL